jgi:hypothetical protein
VREKLWVLEKATGERLRELIRQGNNLSHDHYEKMQEEIAFLKRLATAEAESRRGELIDV